MRLKADLTLLLVAVIWGSAFAAQRVAAANVGPFLFNGCRFLLAALILLPVLHFKIKLRPGTWLMVALAGVLLVGGSVLQQAGLETTTAGNAGFITGMYVIFIPLILLVFWRRRTGWFTWLAAGMAVAGMFLLSAGGKLTLTPGDGLELAGAIFWACHVILIERVMRDTPTLPFAVGQYLAAGIFNLLLGFIFDWKTIPGLVPSWWSVVYIGVFSVGIGYTLQARAQKIAPAADAALIMSMESVFAALFGYIFLGETLLPLQLTGAGLILLAIILSQIKPNNPLNPVEDKKAIIQD